MKDIADYIAAKGWSSVHFFDVANVLLPELAAKGVKVSVGRTVIALTHNDVVVKCYVHRNGLGKEHATFTDANGVELATFHCTDKDKIRPFLFAALSVD